MMELGFVIPVIVIVMKFVESAVKPAKSNKFVNTTSVVIGV